METLLLNGLPVPLPDIKDMDDCIIQGMNFKLSNEEIVNEWDTKIRRRIASKLSVCTNEKICEDVLKDYLRLLKEQAKNFKEKRVLKEKISGHLKMLHLLCYSRRENICLYNMVNYLDYMENVLIFLCNLELEVIRQLKKNHVGKDYNKTVKRVARRLIDNLSVNLLNEQKRIFHVLLKLDSKHEQSWKDVMHIVYNHYMIKHPVRDRSDLSFCRYYLLFQKWKAITDKNHHKVMDKIVFLKFAKTSESIKTNPLLKSILLPTTDCLVDLMDVLTNGQQVTINAYFKYIEGRYDDDEIHVPQSIELDSDDDDEITQQLLFEPSESEKRRNGLIKAEKHNKSSVQENTRYLEISSDDGQVVCVIDDDDSDIEEVCVDDNKNARRRKLGLILPSSRPVVSFLDSIRLPDECKSSSPIHTASTTENETTNPPPPPSPPDEITNPPPPPSPPDEITNPPPPPPSPPAEITTLPIVTAYVDSVRKKGALAETETSEAPTLAMESLNIRVHVQKEVACLTNVLNTVSCSEKVEEHDTIISNKIVTSDNSIKNSCVQQDVCVQSEQVISKEVESAIETEKKCTCSCKHSINTNSNTNNNIQSETNKSVTKPNLKTVEIQTDNMDSFNYLCGMITPPSDRTADENSPSSMEHICSDNNNSLHSGNTNVYAYVPSITPTESYVENSSHNRYESETHSYLGVCESSTQVCNFDQPQDTQNQSLSEESSRENNQEQDSNLISLENPYSIEISQNNQEEETPTTEEPITEITEEPVSEITEPEPANPSETVFNETELEGQTIDPGMEEHQFDEDLDDGDNQNEFGETEPENEFNEESFIDDSGEMEMEVNNETGLVSEIEFHDEELSEVLPDVEVSENEILNTSEENQELEQYQDTFDGPNSPSIDDLIIIHKKYHETSDPIEEQPASNEPEIILNNTTSNSPFSDITNVPVIIAECQNTDLQDSTIDIIPYELINTVILGDDYSPDKEIVLVPATDGKDGDEPTKFTVFEITTGIPEESLLQVTESKQKNNGSKNIATEQVLNVKEVSVIKNSSTVVSETAQSCKIQASVTMAQLINKEDSKSPKNGERRRKKDKKKNTIEDNREKIIFTSNERVKSAPLSLFAKFEQSQCDLVENAFSGPLEPILSNKTNINCDNSNSNDSFCLFDSDRSTKDFIDNNSPSISPEAGSPISPPYENIHAQEYQNHMLKVNMESLSTKQTNNLPIVNIDRIEKKKSISETPLLKPQIEKQKPILDTPPPKPQIEKQKPILDTLLPKPQIEKQKPIPDTLPTIAKLREEPKINITPKAIPEHKKEEKRLNYDTIFKTGTHKEEKRLNSADFLHIAQYKEQKKLNPTTFFKIPEYKQQKKIEKVPEYKLIPILFPEEEKSYNYVSPTPHLTSIISRGTSKRKSKNGGPPNKKLKVNFGPTEIRLIPRDSEEALLSDSISVDSMAAYGVIEHDIDCMYRKYPEVVIRLDSTADIKKRRHKLYVDAILNNLLLEKKVKSENSCIMTRVDYDKPIPDSLPKNKPLESPYNSPAYSCSAGCSVPSAITKRIDTPRFSSVAPPPPSGYIPALNTSKPGLKRSSDYSQDNEDHGKYNSDSRTRTRRKRTPTPKAQKPQKPVVVKTPTEPSSSAAPKKRRGRPPKKAATTKSSRKTNSGVLYTNGPFRIG